MSCLFQVASYELLVEKVYGLLIHQSSILHDTMEEIKKGKGEFLPDRMIILDFFYTTIGLTRNLKPVTRFFISFPVSKPLPFPHRRIG
jgi:hypothetical protein